MRKIKFYIIALTFILTGCANSQKDVYIDTNAVEKEVDLQVGFGLQNLENDYFIYDGNEVTINFNYEVIGRDSELGLMIYIDGIPQLLKSSDVDSESLVYKFFGKKDSKNVSTVTFVPNTGKSGDILSMQAALIADCEIVDNLISMANKQHIIVCGKTNLKYNQDSKITSFEQNENVSYQPVSKEIIDKYSDRDNYLEENLLLTFPSNTTGSFKKGEDIPLQIVGTPAIYRVWILEDCTPVQSFYVDLKSGQMALMNIEINNENTKNIKAFAVPINNDFPEQSVALVVE